MRLYTKEALIQMMTERNYTQTESGCDYVMSFVHRNGMSEARYQKREGDLWEACF